MSENDLYEQLRRLRPASTKSGPTLGKPLLLLWLLGQYVTERATDFNYAEAEEPVSKLIARFSPESTSKPDAAALPFVHLERSLWVLEDTKGTAIKSSPSRSGAWLREAGARGHLQQRFTALFDTTEVPLTAAQILLDQYFSPEEATAVSRAVRLYLALSARPVRPTPVLAATRTTNVAAKKVTQAPSGDYEMSVRQAVFDWLEELSSANGGKIPFSQLAHFTHQGKRIAVLNPQAGIHKPAQLGSALSVKTVYTSPGQPRPYEDELDDAGLLRYYKYRGTDPMHRDNVALRNAMEQKLPLFWLKGVANAIYEPHFPLWLTAERPEEHLFEVSFNVPKP